MFETDSFLAAALEAGFGVQHAGNLAWQGTDTLRDPIALIDIESSYWRRVLCFIGRKIYTVRGAIWQPWKWRDR